MTRYCCCPQSKWNQTLIGVYIDMQMISGPTGLITGESEVYFSFPPITGNVSAQVVKFPDM